MTVPPGAKNKAKQMIDNKILRRALEWCNYPKGITISLDVDVQSIHNRDIRDAILFDEQKQRQTPKYYRGKKRKTWYDVENNAIHVILPNIESPRELDRIILDEVLQRRGLAGLVGDNVFDQIARVVFDGQDEQTQKTFLSYVLGNEKRDGDRVAAGKLILSAQTNQFVKASNKHSKENAAKAWYRTTNKYIKPHARELFAFLSDETNLSNIIAAGIRAKAFNDNNTEKMASVTAASVGNEIIKLYDRELEGRILDVGNYIHLGRPCSILLSSAPWTKTCPIFLPLSSLYGDTRDNYNNRFITATEDIKKDKHPFSLMSLVNLKGELDTPLAVFKSIKRDNGLIAMLPSSGGSSANDKQIGHFAVPISLQEINYSKTSGLQKSPGSGKWVNYIHSIYPKPDIGFLCWLSSPGLCSYLDPSFEEKWLKPAEVRIERTFDRIFTETGIKKPSAGEIKTILSTMSADDYIDIKSKLAKFLDLNEAGLPRVYSVYRDVLESATKIVKEFENPKIISSKRILFSVSKDKDLLPGEREVVEALVKKMLQAGIPVHIVPDSDQTLVSAGRVGERRALGYTNGKEIFLSETGASAETAIHEYTHVWAEAMRISNPEKWEKIVAALKETNEWLRIIEDPAYEGKLQSEEEIASEVLAQLSGRQNAERLTEANYSILNFWAIVKDNILATQSPLFSIDNITNMVMADLLSTAELKTNTLSKKVLQDFAKGKGVKISKKDGERLAAMAEFERNRIRTTEYISKSNERFNEELQRQIEGEFDSEPHTYNLGYPGPIFRSTGIPNLPIQVTSSKLSEKSNSDKHKYDLNEIKDLVQFMNTPVAVFSYGDGTLAQNIIVGIRHNDKHFLVGLSLNAHINGVALQVNSIRTVFPKDNHEWLTWIQEGKSRYLDKETIKALIAQQRIHPADVNHLDLNLIAKIVDNYENPKVDEKYFIIDNWQYYGVFLDDRSQSVIEREFRDLIPSGWKKHADHITVQYNDYSQDAITKGRALSGKLGSDYSMRIVAVGKSESAIALKVEGVETANKIAHITLAVSPEGKPVDSNKITEWTPVNPVEISGVLGLSYKGKKYFQVLNDNEVVDFQISKDSLTQPKTNMANETLPIGNDTDDITLRKAALFTAWETREDNPYEFVVDLSRTELEEFLKNSFDKLNAEDKDIVTNILNKTPGYGEDFVDKRISGESHFRPDIKTLLFDDLTVGGDVLDRSMFYIATRNMNEEQIQSLHDSVKEKVIAYYAGVDNDAPNADMDKIEALTEKLLHSWFRPWTRLAGRLEYHLDKIQESEAGPVTLQHIEAEARSAMANPAYAPYIDKNLLGWILNRCVDYGLDYTMIPKDLQYEGAAENFRKEFPEYLTKPSKEAQSSLPEDFYSNFRDTMYGSEVISAQPIESTDYVLVYYNSNESENGLGMIPSEEPVLTDGSGHLLAHDRMFGPVDINHLFILADKAVVVGRPDGDDGKRPIVEIPRDKAHYDALFLSSTPDVQANMLKAYVEALTNMEAITMSEMASSYSGNIAVYNAVTALDSQKPETQNGLINAFLSLNLNEKEDVLHLALSEKAINAEMLRTLSSGKAYQEALSSWSARKNAVSETTFDAPEDLLGWMSDVKTKNLIGIPDSPGKNALERIYENALFMAEVEGKRTVEEQKEHFLSFARRCKVGFVIGPDKEHRLQEMLEEAYKKGVIDINDTILIKSKYTGEYGIIQVCSVEDIVSDNKKRIQIGYQSLDDCPVLQVDSKDQIISVEYRGIDDRRPTYNYSPDGTLLSISRKNSSMYSLPDAIIDMRNELSPEFEKMNYLELRGLYDELRVLRAAIVGADLCGFGKERIDLSIDVVDSLLHVVYSETAAAKQDLLQYIDRGQRTNNTIIDRLLNRTFSPTHPLPSPDDIKSAGIDNIKAGTIKETYIEKYASEKGLNLLPSTAPRTERRMSFPTGVVRESDISEMPQYFNLQLDVAGRIDGTVGLRDGSNVVVQREGNSLMSMHPQDIHDSITAQVKGTGEGRLIQVDGKDYHVEDKLIMALSYGNGQYLNTNNNERTYVVYDIKQQRLVKAEPFEKLNRERCTRKAEENKAKKQSEGLTVAKENGNKKGRGGR